MYLKALKLHGFKSFADPTTLRFEPGVTCPALHEELDVLIVGGGFGGLYAARADSAINRVWRDFHTASQHALLLPQN